MSNKSNIVEKRVDLVLEGGGVKGVALAGALSVLEEQGYEPQNVAGASAGAIVATLLAAGYKGKEIGEIISTEDFRLFMDKGWEDRLPAVIGLPISLLKDQGIFEGDYFLNRMRSLLDAKHIHTFYDLRTPEYGDRPEYQYKVQVIASDITEKRLLVLPRDAKLLGINPDELEVAVAVRMSMSFPIFFEPYHWINPTTKKEHLIVDGGMLSNFPVWLFDSEGKPSWPTFGLRLVEDDNKTSLGDRMPVSLAEAVFGPTVSFLLSMVSTALEAHDRMYIENSNFARTIAIPTLGVSTLDFSLPREKTDALYQSGIDAAKKFLSTWNFKRYVATFRSDATPLSRTDNIIANMRKGSAISKK